MNMMIPNELFNTIDPPTDTAGQASVRVTDYIQTVASNLPSCSDFLIEREFWNIVNDFCQRTGALREKTSGTLDNNLRMYVDSPTYGDFLRFVGAGTGSGKTAPSSLSASYESHTVSSVTTSVPTMTFPTGSSGTCYVTYSVVPDINATHDKTKGSSAPYYANDKWILPKWFLRMYDKALLAGTNFKLYGMVGRPWTDFNMARTNAFSYNREINRITHGLITSGMRKQALNGIEMVFIGNAQAGYSQTTQTTQQ